MPRQPQETEALPWTCQPCRSLWPDAPAWSNIPSAAPMLCIYPGFGEVPIATGCRPHLGIYIAELICTILATFKWLRERVFKNKVLLLHRWLWLPFTLSTQQFLSLRYCVDKSSSTTWSWESYDYSQGGSPSLHQDNIATCSLPQLPTAPLHPPENKRWFAEDQTLAFANDSFTFSGYEAAKVSSKLWMAAPKRS